MRVEIFLVLTLLGLTYGASTYRTVFQTQIGATNYDYFDWRDYAWKLTNANGAQNLCSHLATYETEAEFNSIFSSALASSVIYGPGKPVIFYVGAQKQPNSNLFVWAVGSRRGQPFFSANLIPVNFSPAGIPRYFDINYEDGFICHQEFCFDHQKFFGYQGVYDAEVEAVLFRYNPNYIYPYRTYAVTAEDYDFVATYGVFEDEDAGKIANANGGSKFYVSYTALPWAEASNEANVAGAYLARIETSEQEQWIRDEMQCISSTTKERFWMGYQQDVLTNKIVKGPGPAQRQVLWDPITGCTTDLYCQFSTGTPAKRSVDYLTGEAPSNAVFFDSADGKWYAASANTARRFLYQAEYCSFNADHFFRNSFGENERSDSRICVPNPTDDWSSADNRFDGNHGYFSEKSFYAGAGVFFQNPENSAKKLLYFDCNCETDPIIDKACLGSEDWPGCAVYTNNFEYYLNGQYLQRLIDGLAAIPIRYLEYLYWNYLYYLS